jgi:hypothetical protein
MSLRDKRWSFHLALISIIFAISGCSTQSPSPRDEVEPVNIELGDEYSDFSKPSRITNLPKEAYAAEEHSLLFKTTSYICDRFLDLLDVAKIDVGLGRSQGGVLRVSRYVQMGARRMKPASLRFGLRGRDWPVFMERVDEVGFVNTFRSSPSREISPLELGAGLDLFIAGAYVGLSVDGLFDFLTGFVGIDVSGDDGALYR